MQMIIMRTEGLTETQILLGLKNKGFSVSINDPNGFGFNSKFHVSKDNMNVIMDAKGNLVSVPPKVSRKPPFYRLHNNSAPTDLADARKALFG